MSVPQLARVVIYRVCQNVRGVLIHAAMSTSTTANRLKRADSPVAAEPGDAKRLKRDPEAGESADGGCSSQLTSLDCGITPSRPAAGSQLNGEGCGDTSEEASKQLSSSTYQASEAEYWRKAKKMILLLSYSGKGYLGMQRNPGCRTIEEELLQALYKARAIPEQGLREQQSVWFQRAARTDKGVSAAKQTVSLKMVAEDGVLEAINQHLPGQIRVFAMKRVTKKFDAKMQCCGRTYIYITPSFAFCPIDGVVTENYRITDEVLNDVNQLFTKYVGTHNYHNFTSRRKPNDPSNKRYIINMSCGRPFIRHGIEFVVVTVKGQSFMLHQIRKMVGLVMAVSRGHADELVFDRAWSLDRIDLPIAPALGLMLSEAHYDRYNQRFGSGGCKTHEDIEWSAEDDQVDAFKEQHIYPDIVSAEQTDKSMLTWLGTLGLHTFDVREGDSPLRTAHNLVREANSQPALYEAAGDQSASSEAADDQSASSEVAEDQSASSEATGDQSASSEAAGDQSATSEVAVDRSTSSAAAGHQSAALDTAGDQLACSDVDDNQSTATNGTATVSGMTDSAVDQSAVSKSTEQSDANQPSTCAFSGADAVECLCPVATTTVSGEGEVPS